MTDPLDALALVPPSRDYLDGYVAALRSGWSPDTTQDVCREQLVSIRRDADVFLADLLRQDGTIRHADGGLTQRLPNRQFWLWDGEFCGMIGLRFLPGRAALPPQVPGHVGYSVVPEKRRLGYATRALALMLEVAREEGLKRVFLSCKKSNIASRKVIEANGGIPSGRRSFPPTGALARDDRGYWIMLDRWG
jgi:predicted acetyltransferase